MRLAIGLMLLALVGCTSSEDVPPAETGIALDRTLGAPPDPGFARAVAPREFVFPADHGPHPAFATEWWYFTGNLRSADGRRFGYQLTLFRVGLRPGQAPGDSPWRTHQMYMGHLALSDIANRRHLPAERFSRAALGLAGAVSPPLRVWLGPWAIEGGDRDGLFPVRLRAASDQFGIDLELDAGHKPRVLQGDAGLSRKSAAPGNASYYYSYTRLPTRGTLQIGAETVTVTGDSWFDREWSSSALAADQSGWDWFALQLDDGRDLMYYQLRDKADRPQRFSQGVLVESDGTVRRLGADRIVLQPTRYWQTDDGVRYPVGWRLRVPTHDLDLDVQAAFDAQEMRLTVRYWEGAVTVSGSQRGVGYLELSGYAR